MRKTAFRYLITMILVALTVCGLLFLIFSGRYLYESTAKAMLNYAALTDNSINYSLNLQSQTDAIEPLIMNGAVRITIIDKNGVVAADSSQYAGFSENHTNRKEIQAAIANGSGISLRYSDTAKCSMLYAAVLSKNSDYIIRLAIAYDSYKAFLGALLPSIIISIITAFIISLFVAERLAASIAKPLNEISNELSKIQEQGEVLNLKEYKIEEINDIAKATRTLSKRIERYVESLKFEKRKIDYILDNMNEGLVLIDENHLVVTINKAAAIILNAPVDFGGENIIKYTQNLKILNGVEKVLENDSESSFDIHINSTIYFVHITKVKKGIFDKSTASAIILIMNVTTEREAQRIKQEFFSNASHELKTPITSIQGYSELLLGGAEYSEETKNEFISRIRDEAVSMTSLINDFLTISKLEAGHESSNISEFSAIAMTDDILNLSKLMIEKNKLTVYNQCEDIIITADYSQLYQLINNLIVNSVKYNKPGGTITLTIKNSETDLIIIVADTGVGIPAEAQQRVFERFYRVDTGRSKTVGGTGLGLSIVKHIVSFYNGEIELKSKINIGTEITIKLPKLVKQ